MATKKQVAGVAGVPDEMVAEVIAELVAANERSEWNVNDAVAGVEARLMARGWNGSMAHVNAMAGVAFYEVAHEPQFYTARDGSERLLKEDSVLKLRNDRRIYARDCRKPEFSEFVAVFKEEVEARERKAHSGRKGPKGH